MQRVEAELLDREEFKTIYSRTFASASNMRNMPADAIGVIQIEFIDWQFRQPAAGIIEQLRTQLGQIAGIRVQVRKQESGPSGGKPVNIELSSLDYAQLDAAVEYLRGLMRQAGGFVDIEDNRALPGIEWQLEIDRELAARYGADVVILGNSVQLITNGLKLTEYQPDDVDEELDIRLRYPADERSMEQLMQLTVATARGIFRFRTLCV